jgi:hypothetical protein
MAHIIPGDTTTYIYDNEKDYYEGYATSLFGKTKCKAGWDCMRHYEILANGCIPWFENLENCPPNTLTHLPKELIIDTMKNFQNLGAEKLLKISKNLLDYTRKHLTTKAMASYVLEISGNQNAKKILYLSNEVFPDYLRELLLIGFKDLLGSECHDSPHIPFLYSDYPQEEASKLYGKGISYTRTLSPELHDSSKSATIIQDIENHVYDCVVYGSIHRGMPLFNHVTKYYKHKEIILLCGEDLHDCEFKRKLGDYSLFIREL